MALFRPKDQSIHPRVKKIKNRRRGLRGGIEIGLLAFLIFGLFEVFIYQDRHFKPESAVLRVVVAVAVLLIGLGVSRAFGRWKWYAARMDASTAGTVKFVARLFLISVTAVMSLRVLGFERDTLALGGAVTGIVVGLAAQQTLGNVFAGLVLISARPFHVGDRLQMQAGGLAGQIEGVVISLGLLYTTLARGEDSIMVPNTVVLSAAVVPLREPASVDLKARLRPDVRPTDIQNVLDAAIKTPVRDDPHIDLEEVRADEIVVRVSATPIYEADGRQLADEILGAIGSMTGEGGTDEREAIRSAKSTAVAEPLTQEFES